MLYDLRYFDFFYLTAIAAACYAALVMYLRKIGKYDLLMVWGAALLAAMLPLSWLVTSYTQSVEQQRFCSQFKSLAFTLANEMRGLGHAEIDDFFTDQRNSDARYKLQVEKWNKKLEEWLSSNKQHVQDMFTFAFDNATKHFRVVSDSPVDIDLNGIIDGIDEAARAHGSVLDRDPHGGIKASFEGSFGFDSDRSSGRLSVYAPIQDQYGKVRAIFVADLQPETFHSAMLESRRSSLAQMFAIALVVLAGILFAGMLRADIRSSAKNQAELRAAHQSAKDAAEKARKATEAKGQFLANMSHEIRTPLNGVIGMSEVMLQTKLTQDQRKYQTILLESARSLLELLNDILDFSKIEAGKIELEAITFEVHELVATAMQNLSQRANEKKLRMLLKIAPNVPETIVGDPVRLRQVVVNLVSNAIKFTRFGEIEVSLYVGESEADSGSDGGRGTAKIQTLLFSVRDTGIGIAPSQRTRVFESFTQADASTTRNYGGTGLGLAICSNLVKLMGGSIWFDTEVGKGSTFFFQVPLVADVAEATDHSTELCGMKALVVSGRQLECSSELELLENEGVEVALASEARVKGRKSLGTVPDDRRFDFVLVDIAKSSDCQAVAPTLDLPSLNKVPVVLLRPMSSELIELPTGRLGPVHQLFKPVTRKQLLQAVRAALDERPDHAAGGLSVPISRVSVRVLLADDAVVNREVAQSLLERRGHIVTTVSDGRQAVDEWRSGQYDIILMDIQMPELDGVQATRCIREQEGESDHIPIVAMTAAAMSGDRDMCLESGMDAYLSKPFRPAELYELVERFGQKHVDANHDDELELETTDVNCNLESSSPRLQLEIETLLANTGHDHELAKQMSEIFIDESRIQLGSLNDAISKESGDQIAKAAHLLRGSVAIFGAKECVAILRELEERGRSNQLQMISRTFQDLKVAVNILLDELRTSDYARETVDSRCG